MSKKTALSSVEVLEMEAEQHAETQRHDNAKALRCASHENLLENLRNQKETIEDLRKKCNNYKTALDQSQAQLSKLMRVKNVQPAFVVTNTAAAERADYDRLSAPNAARLDSEQTQNEPNLAMSAGQGGDLEMDGCVSFAAYPQQPEFYDKASQSLPGGRTTPSRLQTDSDVCHPVRDVLVMGRLETEESSKPQTYARLDKHSSFIAHPSKEGLSSLAEALPPATSSETTSAISLGATSGIASLPDGAKSSTTSMTISFDAGAAACGDASPDLVAKLMSQNARLKNVMRDILKTKGLTLSDYLDKQEHEDVVEQLRQELKQARATIEHFKVVIAQTGDVESLERSNAELIQKVTTLEKSLMINKVMVQSYSQQCERLKMEANESSLVKALDDAKAENHRQQMKLQTILDASAKNVEILQGQLAQSKQTEKQLVGMVQELKTQLAVQTEKLDEAEAKIEHQNMQIATYKEDFSTVDQKRKALLNQLKKTEKGRHERVAASFIQSVESARFHPRASDIGIDGAQDSGEPERERESGSADGALKCPRCDRDDFEDEARFKAHREKCTDD